MIEVFGFHFRLYGLVLGLGLLVGAWIASKVAGREGADGEVVWDGLVWVVVFGVVGARAYHVIDLWSYYSVNLAEIVMVWNGGIGIFGALIGGVAGGLVYARRAGIGKDEVWKVVDASAFGIPVGQAIGRWGNFFNQELYGKPTDLPWGIPIDPVYRAGGVETFSHFHPLFLYEGMLNLVLFGVMIAMYRYIAIKRWRVGSGKFMGVYMVGYGLIRFLLEPMRIGNWKFGELPVAWVFSVMMIAVGGYLMMRTKALISKS